MKEQYFSEYFESVVLSWMELWLWSQASLVYNSGFDLERARGVTLGLIS